MATTNSIKQEARKLVDNLPDDASWEDLQYQIYVRQKIDEGLEDGREGRVVSHEEVKKRFASR